MNPVDLAMLFAPLLFRPEARKPCVSFLPVSVSSPRVSLVLNTLLPVSSSFLLGSLVTNPYSCSFLFASFTRRRRGFWLRSDLIFSANPPPEEEEEGGGGKSGQDLDLLKGVLAIGTMIDKFHEIFGASAFSRLFSPSSFLISSVCSDRNLSPGRFFLLSIL